MYIKGYDMQCRTVGALVKELQKTCAPTRSIFEICLSKCSMTWSWRGTVRQNLARQLQGEHHAAIREAKVASLYAKIRARWPSVASA